MIMGNLWLIKIILAHLLTDFILQPRRWIQERRPEHFRSASLYIHGLIIAGMALLLTGWIYWPAALIILLTHIGIDGWKSYKKESTWVFLTDQFLQGRRQKQSTWSSAPC